MSPKLSRVLSTIFSPLLNSTFAFLILIGADGDLTPGRKVQMFSIAFIVTSVVPIVYLGWMKWRGTVDSMDVDRRQQRLRPLIVGITSYAIGFVLLARLQAPDIVLGLMFCYATNTLFILLITRTWKVSVHATGISGPVVALVFRFGWHAVPLFILIPVVAWARVALGKHTVVQVVVGALIGIFLTAVQLRFLFDL